MAKGKNIIIGCGGAGANIVGKTIDALVEMNGKGFADSEAIFFDTSKASIKRYEGKGGVFLVEGVEDGSGGDQMINIKYVRMAVKSFIDKYNIKPFETGVYYTVVYGIAGGSGSGIGTLLIEVMMEYGIHVQAVIVGDTSTALYTENTRRSIVNLDRKVRAADKILPVRYFDNYTAKGTSYASRLEDVDKSIFHHISTFNMLASGENYDIDQMDVAMLIDPKKAKSGQDTPAGLYVLMSLVGQEITVPAHLNVVHARTLTTDDISPDLNVDTQTRKVGYIANPEILEIYGKGSFPFHYLLITNYFTSVMHEITTRRKHFTEMKEKITVDNFDGEEDVESF